MARYEEIDILKGIAVILMVIFHIFYLGNHMGFKKIDASGNFLYMMAKIAHLTFIFMAGINLFISKNKNKDNKNKFYKNNILRSTKLLIYGLIITIITYYLFGEAKYVKFGILHFISIAIILSLFIADKLYIAIVILIIFVFLQMYTKNRNKFSSICSKNPVICFIMGIYGNYNGHIGSMDHFALIKVYPIFFSGIIIGNLLYKKSREIKKKKPNKLLDILAWTGKKSLQIYLIHWIVIFIVLYCLGGRPTKYY